jgi:hypothetical protein
MPYQPIPNVIAQADIDNVKTMVQDLITAIDALNPNNTALTPTERQAGRTIGQKRKPFSDLYFSTKNGYPTLKPSQTEISELNAEKHYFNQDKLTELELLLTTAQEKLGDIKLNAEHFVFRFASKGRLAAKNGVEAGLPGADSFFNALDELYPQSDGPDPGNP